ncbi:MAG: small basic protein [Planctomycetota bacterium]|nr:small basic protein [Planctomycetota bacterium]
MSLDRSLKTAGNLAGKRSVLKRSERIQKLKVTKDFDFSKHPVIGLPKTSAKGGAVS